MLTLLLLRPINPPRTRTFDLSSIRAKCASEYAAYTKHRVAAAEAKERAREAYERSLSAAERRLSHYVHHARNMGRDSGAGLIQTTPSSIATCLLPRGKRL